MSAVSTGNGRAWQVATAAVLFAVVVTGCSSGEDGTTTSASGSATSANPALTVEPSTTTTAPTTDAPTSVAPPVEKEAVKMARADWPSGYVQAEIYRQILAELGYEVVHPAELEMNPSQAYSAMAAGDVDFWTNSWYPADLTWHQGQLPDGSQVGDHLTIVDGLLQDAAVQGYLVTKTVADANGIQSIQQINDDPELVALFDAADAAPGNGVIDVFGCQEDWNCGAVIESQIAFHGWDNVRQTRAGYQATFAHVVDLVSSGEPAIIYTWTPSSYVTQLVPGDNVLWISTHPTDVLDDSNPLGVDGGEFHDQLGGFTGYGVESCTQPCQLGWAPVHVQVTANSRFLADNPLLTELFPLIRPSVFDISKLQVELAAGDGSEDHVEELAARWLTDNRALVDEWKATALTAVE